MFQADHNTSDELIPNAPVCLVKQNGKELTLCEEGLELLRAYDNHPVATVTVAGLYRTGKSFFLNQLAGTSGFKVGSTVQSCTRGIWMWPVPASRWQDPNNPNTRLILLDTEGLASMDNDENYDAKIFSLGILLASFFVYNSMGVIDESAIDRLFLVGELSKNICISTTEGDTSMAKDPVIDESKARAGSLNAAPVDELAQFFPPFLWLLRDFSLDLVRDGRTITEREYLEQALEDRPGSSARVLEHNQIRHSFKSLFPDRACATMIRPVLEESDLRQLTSVRRDKFRPEFLQQLDRVTKMVLQRASPKRLFNDLVTGRMLASLAHSYVTAINGGAIPNIKKGYEYMVEDSYRAAFEVARGEFTKFLQSRASQKPFLTRSEFDELFLSSKQQGMEVFTLKTSVGGGGVGSVGTTAQRVHWVGVLEDEMEKIRSNTLASLQRQSYDDCLSILNSNLESFVAKPLQEGQFDEVPSEFMQSMLKFLQMYNELSSGPAKETVIAQHLTKEWFKLQQSLLQRVVAWHETKTLEQSQGWKSEVEHRKRVEVTLEGREEMLRVVQSDLEICKSELQSTKEQRDELQVDLQTEKMKHAETNQALSLSEQALQATTTKLEEERISANQRIEKLEQKLTRYRQKHEKVVEKYETLKESAHATERELDSTQRSLEELQRNYERERDEHVAVRTELTTNLERLGTELAQVKATNDDANRTIMQRDSQIMKLQGDSEVQQVHYQQKVQELERVNSELEHTKEVVTNLEATLTRTKEDIQKQEIDLSTTKSSLSNAESEVKKLAHKLQIAKESLGNSETSATNLKHQLLETEAKYKAIRDEMKQLGKLRTEEEEKYGSVIATLEHTIENQNGEMGSLESNIRGLQLKQTELEQERELLLKQKGDIALDAESLMSEIASVRQQLMEERNTSGQLKQSVEQRNTTLAQLQQAVEEERSKCSNLEHGYRELEKVIEEKEALMQEITSTLDRSAKDNRRNSMLESEIHTLYEKIERIKVDHEALDREHQRTKQELIVEKNKATDLEVKQVMENMTWKVWGSSFQEKVDLLATRLVTLSEEKAEVVSKLQHFMTQAAELPTTLQERLFNPNMKEEPIYLW